MTGHARYTLSIKSEKKPLASVERMDSWWAKGIGVLGRRSLPAGEGVWLTGAASVHTCFVAFPLDILFLDRDLHVMSVQPGVPPWRALVSCPGAVHTIELGAGTLAKGLVRVGDTVLLTPK